MAGEVIAKVADLLQEALSVHSSVKSVILCTKEGVVVAAVYRHDEGDATVLSTVSAALAWSGTSALAHFSDSRPVYLEHTTEVERVITVLQPDHYLIFVLDRGDETGFKLDKKLTTLQAFATRVELLMHSTAEFVFENLLDRLVKSMPEIDQAMLLTLDGLPLGSVGIANDIELAGLAGSIFANGLTFSESTDHIVLSSDSFGLLVARVDEKRLLLIGSKAIPKTGLVEKILRFIRGGTVAH